MSNESAQPADEVMDPAEFNQLMTTLKTVARTLDLGISSHILLTPVATGLLEARATEAIEALRAKRAWEHARDEKQAAMSRRITDLENAARDVLQGVMVGATNQQRNTAILKLANVVIGKALFTVPPPPLLSSLADDPDDD